MTDMLPETEPTTIGNALYEGYWASSVAVGIVVEVDRMADNPINCTDPTGLDATTQPSTQPATQPAIVPVLKVTEEAKAIGPRGAANYRVEISINNPHADGWIVQHFTKTVAVTDAKGNAFRATKNDSAEYWEAWQVVGGEVFRGRVATAPGGNAGDTYHTVDEETGTKGEIDITGKMEFISDLSYADAWGQVPMAGILPATTQKPKGWVDDGAIDHNLTIKWDDTCSLARAPAGVSQNLRKTAIQVNQVIAGYDGTLPYSGFSTTVSSTPK